MRMISVCLSFVSRSLLPRLARSLALVALVALTTSGLIASILGCGPPENDHFFDITYNPCEPLSVEAVQELRPDERASVERALAMWNEAGALDIRVQRLTDASAPEATRIPVRFEKGAPFVNGYYDDETGEVIINRNLADTRERTITLAHELGHAFGLRHVAHDKRRSLMNAGNLDTAVTPRDIEALRARWQECSSPQQ